jgi:hypothetical protein
MPNTPLARTRHAVGLDSSPTPWYRRPPMFSGISFMPRTTSRPKTSVPSRRATLYRGCAASPRETIKLVVSPGGMTVMITLTTSVPASAAKSAWKATQGEGAHNQGVVVKKNK